MEKLGPGTSAVARTVGSGDGAGGGPTGARGTGAGDAGTRVAAGSYSARRRHWRISCWRWVFPSAVDRKNPTIRPDRLGKTIDTYGAPKDKNRCDDADECVCHLHLWLAERGGRDEYRPTLPLCAKHFFLTIEIVAYSGALSISGPLLRQFPTAGLAGVIFILEASYGWRRSRGGRGSPVSGMPSQRS